MGISVHSCREEWTFLARFEREDWTFLARFGQDELVQLVLGGMDIFVGLDGMNQLLIG